MNSLSQIWQPHFWQQAWHTAGWTMVYFLAAGTAVVFAGGLVRLLCRRLTPQVRYLVSLGTLTTLAVSPIGIGLWLKADSTSDLTGRPSPLFAMSDDGLAAAAPPVMELHSPTDSANSSMPMLRPPSAAQHPEVAIIELNQDAPVDHAEQRWQDYVGYLPWLWLLGTPLTFLLLATGLIGAERLRYSSQPMQDGPIYESCQRLKSLLGIGRRVAVATCDRVATPLLVGIVRPLILLPPAAVTGWSTQELEMVLLHELAHVRRWDNLVNLCQRIVESLLFFHPGVWVASRWVGRDREDCCDAAVLRHSAAKPQAYATLLLELAAQRSPLAGLALAEHPLAARIRRILKVPEEPMRVSRGTIATIGCLLVALVIGVGCYDPAVTEAEETAAVEEEAKEEIEDIEDQRVEESAEELAESSREFPPDTPMEAIQEYIAELKSQGKQDISIRREEEGSVTISGRAGVKPTGVQPAIPVFLTLEEQKKADLAYKLLGVELNALGLDEMERVKKFKFSGGLKVSNETNPVHGLRSGDLLVGLHVWSITSLEDAAKVLTREDIDELSPLKFYAIRDETLFGSGKGNDKLVTGRVTVRLEAWEELRQRNESADSSQKKQAQLEKYRKQLAEKIAELEVGIEELERHYINPSGDLEHEVVEFNLKQLRQRRLKLLQDMDELSELRQFLVEHREPVRSTQNHFLANDPRPSNNPSSTQNISNQQQSILAPWPSNDSSSSPKASPLRSSKRAPTLLYDGKTFEWWRNSWKTELKTEKRIDCIEALTAFGRAGRGKEAAEAILEVAAEYDYLRPGGTKKTQNLKNAIYEALSQPQRLPFEAWVPLVVQRAEENPQQWREFATKMLGFVPEHDAKVYRFLRNVALSEELDLELRRTALHGFIYGDIWKDDEELVAFVRGALSGNDPELTATIMSALWFLHFDKFPEQLDLLFHEDKQVFAAALSCLSGIGSNKHASTILDKLLEILDDSTRTQDHARVVEGLSSMAVFGFNHTAALQKRKSEVRGRLWQVMREGERPLLPHAIRALTLLTGQSEELIISQVLNDDPDGSQERVRELEAAAAEAKAMKTASGGRGFVGGRFGTGAYGQNP